MIKKVNTPIDRPVTPEQMTLGYAFIKTGYDDIRDGLIGDFSSNGLEVIHERVLKLPPRVVDYIYRDSMTEHFFSAMRRHLIENPVRSLALFRPEGDAQQTLLDLKHGRNNRENLRAKYTHSGSLLSADEVRAWAIGAHPDQFNATVCLTQNNVFHTADTASEALNTLMLLGQEYPGYYAYNDSPSRHIGRGSVLLAELCADDTIEGNYGYL